eukprot:Em0018g823a
MGCDCESSVRRLPCLDIRRQVVYAGNDEIDSPSFCRIENVFLKGMKALVHLLLPNLKLKSDLKNAFILKSVVESNEATSADASLDRDSLVTIPSTISDVLKREKYYTSSDARRLLVTLADVPHADVASLLSISKDYASELMFQAKVDRLYLTHGLRLQEHHKTQSRVHRDVVEFAVEFIYSDDNISRLAWVAKKRSPNRNPRWKELTNMFAMRSLVLKHDIASMYEVYTMKHRDVMPGKPPIGRTLFYTIANHITGGGKVQEARAGVDYVKVNFHIDNFVIVDRLINILAPLSDVDHTLRDELHGLRTNAYDFLSYGYSLHAREGVAASDGTEANSHQPQEHEVKQFRAYQELEEMASAPDLFDDPDTQQAFVDHVKAQLSHCAQATRTVVEQSECSGFSTHSPVFSLDLVPNRKPNRDPKLGGHLECNACRGPFVFYDRLRQVALNKLDEDPTRLDETADVLLTVHQCERRTFRYMAHVMQAAQQSLRMKQAIAEMDSTTAYLIFDFKQKFLAKGFREGGDSYYGKKGMLWWGAGVFIKPYSTEEEVSSGESNEKLHVMIDFSDEKVRLLQQGMQDKAGGCEEVDMGDLQNVNYEWISEDEEEVDDDKGVDEVDLHFIDCVVQNEQKADGNIVLSCLEAALHALRQRFPHVTKLIVQSDNAKNLAGKQTKLLLPYVCSAAGLRLVAYYHNEAQSGKDVCDTHFSHQQSRVEAYLVQGNGGRKVSTPKQLAVALMEKSLSNTTVLLVKPDFKAPYRSKVIPAISGISEYYAAQYATTDGQQHIKFYNCLGQKMPSACVPIPSCHATSLINAMVLVKVQVRKDKGRYKKRTKGISQREMQRVQKQHEDEEALKRIQAVYPQCTVCLYHFKSQLLLAKHVCSGVMEHQDVLSIAMRYANTLLATMDFTVSGAVDRASNLLTDDSNLTYATFEFNFYAGWAHTRKKMQPELTTRVTRLIHECWKGGENKDLGKVKISADGVFCRLDELQSQKMIRLSELPVAGKIRVVYQTIGRQSEPKLSDRKRGRSQRNETTQGRQKKARMTFEDLKFDKDLSQWKKEELQTYLCHHNIKKTGNKSELVRRITEYMKTLQN